ncbi:MAG: TonB-dependent receptor [Bacteroidota bacterium]
MRRNFFILSIFGTLILVFFINDTIAQTSGSITGKVTDAQTGEILPGATIFIKDTQNGTTSDIYGEYFLIIPTGNRIVEVRFIGYRTITQQVNVELGTINEINFKLESEAFIGKEIVITAQALGQQAAINQQIQSKSIVTIVSKDRIESLPDQNAAESVGRLAGVSIRREGGEGQQVVVRGLSPRFNSITLNGVRIPSSSAQDRSFDLSTISTDALQGIELYKSWTPNLDGDAIGGTINFVTKKADEGWHGKFRYLHGYNGQQDEFGQHRVNVDLSNRFFQNKFGVLLSGNFQRADRSQDQLDIDFNTRGFDPDNQGNEQITIDDVNLQDRLETRDRFGGNIALDYTFDRGDIRFFSNYSQTNRDRVRRRRRFRPNTNRQEYDFRDRQEENLLLANTLSLDYTFQNALKLNSTVSVSQTEIRLPFDNQARFRENSAFEVLPEVPTVEDVLNQAQNDLGDTFFQSARSDQDNIDFTRITADLNLEYPVKISEKISLKLKGGGKIRLDDRTRDVQRIQANFNTLQEIAEQNPGDLVINDNQILIESFLGDFVAQDFLEGDFFLGPGSGQVNGGHLSRAALNQFFADNRSFYRRDAFVDGGDYESEEQVYAGYFLGDFRIGKKLNIQAGFRNETTRLDFTGFSVSGSASSTEIELTDDPNILLNDSSNARTYTEWLPAVNVKYQVNNWMDVRAAVTKTLSRPSFINLIPFERIDQDNDQLERGNFFLQHQISWNYDLFVSLYNKFGLLTVGGFLKRIDDVDFIRESITSPITPNLDEAFVGFTLTEPVNTSRTSEVMGIEIDLQLNLASLPTPWNGILVSANASFIESTTFFTRSEIVFNPTRTEDILLEGRFPGQPGETYNFSLGYERKGFSGRFSIIHQSDAFGFGGEAGDRPGGLVAEIRTDNQLNPSTGRTTRLDLSITQKVMKNYTVFFNANNITNQEETIFISAGESERQVFGATFDLGLQYKF